MPLLNGKSNSVISSNVRELRNSGRNEAQSVSIALNRAGKGKKNKTVASKVAKMKTGKPFGSK